MPDTKIIHQIRNCLATLQTFLEVVDTSADPKLHQFHQSCRESLERLKALVKELERSS